MRQPRGPAGFMQPNTLLSRNDAINARHDMQHTSTRRNRPLMRGRQNVLRSAKSKFRKPLRCYHLNRLRYAQSSLNHNTRGWYSGISNGRHQTQIRPRSLADLPHEERKMWSVKTVATPMLPPRRLLVCANAEIGRAWQPSDARTHLDARPPNVPSLASGPSC